MKIEKIEPSKHKKGRILLFLDDGTLLKITENELLDFRLEKGSELDSDTLNALRGAADESAAKAKAAELISRRMMSKKQIRDKLTDKGIDGETAAEAADWLEDIGAQSDAEFAAMLVRHYSGSGYGAGKIREEFYRRGVPRELWDQALSEMPDTDTAIDSYLSRKLCGADADDKRAVKRASDGLLRRGFRWDEIRRGLARYGESIEED